MLKKVIDTSKENLQNNDARNILAVRSGWSPEAHRQNELLGRVRKNGRKSLKRVGVSVHVEGR